MLSSGPNAAAESRRLGKAMNIYTLGLVSPALCGGDAPRNQTWPTGVLACVRMGSSGL